ncbi:hypothetical protein L3X38_017031 [Prunus dulcis]|uniref:Uncharacterized protein n=1 Tax=Prunus dulcis TaxID=3755 RepID=A0AAD4W6D4_PRUDU|nr:hypothetical protein L3X38_017031 [Prunus dulcis]
MVAWLVKWFSEKIRTLINRGDEADLMTPKGHLLANKVVVKFNVAIERPVHVTENRAKKIQRMHEQEHGAGGPGWIGGGGVGSVEAKGEGTSVGSIDGMQGLLEYLWSRGWTSSKRAASGGLKGATRSGLVLCCGVGTAACGKMEVLEAYGKVEMLKACGRMEVPEAYGRVEVSEAGGMIEVPNACGMMEVPEAWGMMEVPDVEMSYVGVGGMCTGGGSLGMATCAGKGEAKTT